MDGQEVNKWSFWVVATMFPAIAFAQIFGPSNYEECVLKGIRDANTEGAVSALKDACAAKFLRGKGNATVSECNLTWNGNKFLPGAPLDRAKFIAIRFKQTSDLVYMPEQMDRKLMRQAIEQQIAEIRKICPGISLD